MRLLSAPPPERITSPGGRRAGVTVRADNGTQVTNDGVVLAWARMRAGEWACLFVWHGMRRVAGAKPRVSARWSWCHIGRLETFVHEPVRPGNPWGLAWYGPHNERFDAAIAEAVATLPESMRQAAAEPKPLAKMVRLASVNPRILWTSPLGS